MSLLRIYQWVIGLLEGILIQRAIWTVILSLLVIRFLTFLVNFGRQDYWVIQILHIGVELFALVAQSSYVSATENVVELGEQGVANQVETGGAGRLILNWFGCQTVAISALQILLEILFGLFQLIVLKKIIANSQGLPREACLNFVAEVLDVGVGVDWARQWRFREWWARFLVTCIFATLLRQHVLHILLPPLDPLRAHYVPNGGERWLQNIAILGFGIRVLAKGRNDTLK